MIRRWFQRVPRGLLLGFVPGLLVIGASGAHPAYAVDTTVADVVNLNGPNGFGPCLDLVNGTVLIEPCNGRSTTQDWKEVRVPNNDNFLLRNDSTGQCLDIKDHDRSSGAQVVPRTCAFDGSDPFELWEQESVITASNGDVYGELANEGDGTDLVMHPSGCSTAPGSQIFMNERSQCTSDWWGFFVS